MHSLLKYIVQMQQFIYTTRYNLYIWGVGLAAALLPLEELLDLGQRYAGGLWHGKGDKDCGCHVDIMV